MEEIKTIAKINNFLDKVITQLKSQTQQKTHKTWDNETNTNKNKNGQFSPTAVQE